MCYDTQVFSVTSRLEEMVSFICLSAIGKNYVSQESRANNEVLGCDEMFLFQKAHFKVSDSLAEPSTVRK